MKIKYSNNTDHRSFILNTYYQGITSIIESEIDYISNLINHKGIKGQANEDLLRNFLIKFLPKKYSVGSGIIFDRNGKFSKQIDIIIYDSYHQPVMLSHGPLYLYPVDVVYCVIEVKTILTEKFFKDAINNIISVKDLDFLQYDTEERNNYNFKPISPFGVIFAYKSSTNNFGLFYSWLRKIFNGINIDRNHLFEKCYILKNTFSIKLPDIDDRNRLSIDFCHLDKNLISFENSKNDTTIKDSNGTICRIDQSRGFLIFLSDLLRLLSLKETYRGALLSKYFPKDFDLETGDEVNIVIE